LIIDTYGLSLIIEPIIVNHLESHSSYKNFRSLYVGLCLKMICYKNDKWRLNINIPPLGGHANFKLGYITWMVFNHKVYDYFMISIGKNIMLKLQVNFSKKDKS